MKINNRPVLALLDTGCSEFIVHSHCVQESDHFPCRIPYKTASSTKTYFPAASHTADRRKGHRVGGGIISTHLCRHVARARSSPLQEVAEGGPGGRI